MENYTQYLCDTFPEVEFEFTLATNSTDYYRYLNDHDDLPDIMTVRRFSLKDKTGIGKAEVEMTNQDPKKLYLAGKLAMYRGTGADAIGFSGREGDHSILLPYFEENEKDNWYLTYPSFQVAASKKAMEDPEREKLILRIMEAMLNQEGQSCISYGKNTVSKWRMISKVLTGTRKWNMKSSQSGVKLSIHFSL